MSYIIEACLVVDPCKRPPVNEIIAHLYSVAQQLNEDLNSEPVCEYSTGAIGCIKRGSIVPGICLVNKNFGDHRWADLLEFKFLVIF